MGLFSQVFFWCIHSGFGLPGDHYEWIEEMCWVSCDRASLTLSQDTWHPLSPNHDGLQAAQSLRGASEKAFPQCTLSCFGLPGDHCGWGEECQVFWIEQALFYWKTPSTHTPSCLIPLRMVLRRHYAIGNYGLAMVIMPAS